MWRLALRVAFMAVLYKAFDISLYIVFLSGTMLYLVTGGWRWLLLVKRTIRRDVLFLKASLFALIRGLLILRKNATLGDVFSDVAQKRPEEFAFISADDDTRLTFKDAEQLSRKVANVFYSAGYRKGDVVVLLMENRIEYIPIWLGMTMIGVITSLVNCNLRGESLRYSISVCKCKAIVFSEEMSSPLKEIAEHVKKVDLYCFDECESIRYNVIFLSSLLESATCLPLPKFDELSLKDAILYMYTSGTTGLPKAAVQRGAKCLLFSLAVNESIGIGEKDVIYSALPLYHGNAGLIMGCMVVINGATMVIKKQFSASNYMKDCCKYNATIINYIGETCRYLLLQPNNNFDRKNKIRIAMGNGLRVAIWDEFKERFDIPLIVELYGSTEGNVGVMNVVGKRGAVGFNLTILRNLLPIKLIKVDEETGGIVRHPNGLAVEAKVGEPGQVVGKIKNNSIFRFDGYLDKTATQSKISHDIFSKGDSVFLSGDLLIQDEEGYYYFHDRTGDTFRWKGENVSANEVEGVISRILQLTDVCVYATEIPGNEGKAGMACICDANKKVDVIELHKALQNTLPRYAHPVFLRMARTMEMTDTFKLQKYRLSKEGFNPTAVSNDDLFYLSNKDRKYLPLDIDVYEHILNEELCF